jgi:hypothetical protein
MAAAFDKEQAALYHVDKAKCKSDAFAFANDTDGGASCALLRRYFCFLRA